VLLKDREQGAGSREHGAQGEVRGGERERGREGERTRKSV